MPAHVAEGNNEISGLLSFNDSKVAQYRFGTPLPPGKYPVVNVMPTGQETPVVAFKTRPVSGDYRNGFAIRLSQAWTGTMTFSCRIIDVEGMD